MKSLNQSAGSSSTSSISAKSLGSLDSPSASTENMVPSSELLQSDSDFEVEPELLPLEAFIPKEVLKKLKNKEKKRQEVINGEFLEILDVLTNQCVLSVLKETHLSLYK